jgi:hypothetical protein
VGVTVTAAARQRASRRVSVRVTCAAACTLSVRGSVLVGAGGGSPAGHTGMVKRQLPAGRPTALTFRIAAALRRAVAVAANRGHGARLRFDVTARAGAGGPARHASASSRLVR